jgi:PAS domain S-box-containing protein
MTEDCVSPYALRDSLARSPGLGALRTAIADLPEAVLITDRHGRYVLVNDAAVRLTGYEPEELLKKAFPDLTATADVPVSDVLWRVFLEQGHQTGEYTLAKKDGSTVLVRYEALANVIPGYHASFLRPSHR